MSASHSAAQVCEKLVHPLHQLDPHHLEGRWALIAGSLNHEPSMEALRLRDSITMYFSNSSEASNFSYTQINRFEDQCQYLPYNMSVKGSTFTFDVGNRFDLTGSFLYTSCPDCVVMRWVVRSQRRQSLDLYLLSKRREVEQKEMEEFRAQLRCYNLPTPVVMDPTKRLSNLSTDECFGKEGFSSLEGEEDEWISDAEIILDPAEGLTSPDNENSQEWPRTPPLAESADGEVDATSEEMTGDNMTTEENVTELNFYPDGFDSSEPENNMSDAGINSTHHSPSDRSNSDDVYTVDSPPFADESEGEEEVRIGIVSSQQQPSYSANISVSTEQTSTLPALPSAEQQRRLSSQAQCELAPRGANQEAAQQVLGQRSPPLSTVAMDLSNQGGVTSQGSGCVVAVRERHSRAGERTEVENQQTGGEEGQKKVGLERNKVAEEQHGRGLLKFPTTVQTQELKAERYRFVSSKHTRMESDLYDDSDSGVSADLSPCSTLEGKTSSSLQYETPIEREIRRAIEREQSLRRSRGLPNPSTSPEYVEIPLRKTVLCQPLSPKSESCQGKDRQFAGKKMQHEIHEESKREQDLVKLGKVPGFYDKGTVRQLKERKKLFEAFQAPSDSILMVSTRDKVTSWSSVSDIFTLENQKDISSQASTFGGSNMERSPTQSLNPNKQEGSASLTPRGPGFSEGKGCRVTILENNPSVKAQKLHRAKPEAEPVTVVDSGRPNISSSRTKGRGGIKEKEQENEMEEKEVSPKKNPFFTLRSPKNVVKVEQDIQEAQEREKEFHKQRISLYGAPEGAKRREGEGGSPISAEGKGPTLSSSSHNGSAVPDSPGSPSRGVTGTPTVRQSAGKFGMSLPAQAEEKINLPEVLHSPRATRQKNPMVQRWELGLINGHNEEDD
ncbi:hypothetical protein L3Q82_005417 [Scortum barcoo]|uniref:Uncharacterized protein n=1 Tax=Scortum barcoo TaxID=214431 RepID=A0ACB8VD50_9TELE|nr:hypothetical protein L3Q82_005417 [Scortum barcoo]